MDAYKFLAASIVCLAPFTARALGPRVEFVALSTQQQSHSCSLNLQAQNNSKLNVTLLSVDLRTNVTEDKNRRNFSSYFLGLSPGSVALANVNMGRILCSKIKAVDITIDYMTVDHNVPQDQSILKAFNSNTVASSEVASLVLRERPNIVAGSMPIGAAAK